RETGGVVCARCAGALNAEKTTRAARTTGMSSRTRNGTLAEMYERKMTDPLGRRPDRTVDLLLDVDDPASPRRGRRIRGRSRRGGGGGGRVDSPRGCKQCDARGGPRPTPRPATRKRRAGRRGPRR